MNLKSKAVQKPHNIVDKNFDRLSKNLVFCKQGLLGVLHDVKYTKSSIIPMKDKEEIYKQGKKAIYELDTFAKQVEGYKQIGK